MDKTGIFLTGGGGIGAFHIGFFKALEERNIKYDVICGSSVGALVGGAATYLNSKEMLEAWSILSLESVLKIDSQKVKDKEGFKRNLILYRECLKSCLRKDPNYMIDINDIRKLLYSVLDGEQIKKSQIELGVTTTELPSMKMQKIYTEDMQKNPLEYILASIYLPIFSRQRIINDKHYIDIAGYRRFPLEMLKEKNCKKIYIVNIETNHLKRLQNPIHLNFNTGEEITIIDYDKKPSSLDFSHEQTKVNYRNGYETTMKVLEKKLVYN